ncbi:MAG: hypothetical protein ACE37F_30590 [Nannocystaceae bacterium]|nr:hypothetical protein [bacterium]
MGSSSGDASPESTTTNDPADPSGSSSGGSSSESSSAGLPADCDLLDEGIDIPRLDVLGPKAWIDDVPCEVTDDGFLCTFDEGEQELVDIDTALEGFVSLPWQAGETVVLGGITKPSSAYEAYLRVSNPDGVLLALVVWNMRYLNEPFALEMADIGCEDSSAAINYLEATYRHAEDSVTILGNGTGALGEYTVVQAEATDYSPQSGGELGHAATFAIVLNP